MGGAFNPIDDIRLSVAFNIVQNEHFRWFHTLHLQISQLLASGTVLKALKAHQATASHGTQTPCAASGWQQGATAEQRSVNEVTSSGIAPN